MGLRMPGPVAHPKTGVYQLRRRVPRDLIQKIGKREVKESLGTCNRREARLKYTQRLAEIEREWAELRRKHAPQTNVVALPLRLSDSDAFDAALPVAEQWLRNRRLQTRDESFWRADLHEQLWRQKGFVNLISPTATHPDWWAIAEMERWCLTQADRRAAALGWNLDQDGRCQLARGISTVIQRAAAEFEAGPRIVPAEVTTGRVRPTGKEASLKSLLEAWWQEARAAGRKPSTFASYSHTIKTFIAFLGHDDAHTVTRDDVVRYKDHRLRTPSETTGRAPSAKTVKDSDLSALKTIFAWAVANGKLQANPAAGVTIKVGKRARLRSQGFTDAEAAAILRVALCYESNGDRPQTAAAKRWVPWLAAYTGARVGELAQLRKADVRQVGEHWIIRITPEAGTVKTNEAREVVLHEHLLELGFVAFVQGANDGHLFLKPAAATGDVLGPLQGLKNRLAEFARQIVSDPNVAPNHGWRHLFKTKGREAGIESRVLDAIQGHAPRSVADSYGDVTIQAIAKAMSQFSRFEVSA